MHKSALKKVGRTLHNFSLMFYDNYYNVVNMYYWIKIKRMNK